MELSLIYNGDRKTPISIRDIGVFVLPLSEKKA